MTLRDILLVLHIAGAGTWLGANLLQAVVPRLAGQDDSRVLAGWYRIAGRLSKPIYIPAGVTILVTGVWMVLVSDTYSFADVFVTIGFAVIIIGAVLGSLVFDPTSSKVATALDAGDQATARQAMGKLAGFGALDTLLVLFAILVMVLRLGA